MGSAQSARRIQPGGARPAVPVVPADLSRSPFLPTPPPARRSPLPASRRRRPRSFPSGGGCRRALRRRARGVAGARGRGRGWGRRGTAPRSATGRRRAHFHRGGAPRPAPGRLGRPGGEGGSGGAASPVGAEPPRPECYSPPAAALAESRGRGSRIPVAALSPRPLPPALPPEGVRGGWSRGPGRPSHGATALPPPRRLPRPPRGVRGPGGAGRTVPSAPRASSRRRARGGRRHASLSPPSSPEFGWGGGRSRAHGVGGDVGYPPDPS